MLNDTITLSYSDDGTVAASDHVFNKRAHERSAAEYRSAASVANATLPEDSILLSVTEAKATANFYGTRRANVTTRRGYTLANPLGEALYPAVIKTNFSFPVGMSVAEQRREINKHISFIASEYGIRLITTLET